MFYERATAEFGYPAGTSVRQCVFDVDTSLSKGVPYLVRSCRFPHQVAHNVPTSMDRNRYSVLGSHWVHKECGFSYKSGDNPASYLIWSANPSYQGGSCGTANVGRSWSKFPNYGCNNMVTFVRSGTYDLLSSDHRSQQVQSHPSGQHCNLGLC